MSEPGHAIEVCGLRKSFGAVPVLRGIDLCVPPGAMLGLLGPNGAGKTTAVRILSTLLAADAGSLRVAGHDVRTHPERVRASIGLTAQSSSLDALLTGRENLVLLGRLFHVDKRTARRRAAELLAQFDLLDAADRQVRTYSGGMRRRLDLAVSLITAPPVLFLDEPTTGLDPRSRQQIWDAIAGLLADGVSILLTTQYLEEADRLADAVAVIDGGRIVAQGTPEELKRRLGGERLNLSVPDRGQFGRAVSVLAAEDPRPDERAHSISVAVTGSRDVKRLLDLLEKSEVDIEGIATTRPTLDDVFLSLTGQPRELEITP